VLTGMRVRSTRKKTVPPPWLTVPDAAASPHTTSPPICHRRRAVRSLHGFAEGMRCRARATTEDPRRHPPRWLPPETLATALANCRRPGKVGKKGIGEKGVDRLGSDVVSGSVLRERSGLGGWAGLVGLDAGVYTLLYSLSCHTTHHTWHVRSREERHKSC
jgi:hypothetical protein